VRERRRQSSGIARKKVNLGGRRAIDANRHRRDIVPARRDTPGTSASA